METRRALSEHIAETMNHQKVSTNKLAKESGVALTTLHRKLNGGGDFTIAELGLIARVLDLTVGDLIPTEILDAAA